MIEIVCFGEDSSHKKIISTILNRLFDEEGVPFTQVWRNATRGHGAVIKELRLLLRDIQRDRGRFPDLIVVATDGNCEGYIKRRNDITNLTDRIPGLRVVCAVPDPHIERWLLIDPSAFKAVLDVGCQAPDQKCERDRYKKLLRDAIRQTGISPALGGIEYAEDIVNAMDLDRSARSDPSLAHFLSELRPVIRGWRAAIDIP
ncbi:MAG: DUF4276 family protein [Acetobacteraceae bacterium]|nr:DUF4276 family protein [Acetobacteraceae bacterium]